MAEGKLDLFAIGQGGVNVDANPAQIKQDEARQLQNAILDSDEAVGGLRKRGGMPRFNASTLGGSITGGISVPLPNPQKITSTMYAALGTSDSNTWATSTNGTTWTAGTAPSVRGTVPTKRIIGSSQWNQTPILSAFQRKLWYPSNDYTVGTDDPPIQVYDGTTGYEIANIPTSPIDGDQASWITCMALHNGVAYIAVNDPGGVTPNQRGRVFQFDHATGTLTQIGQAFSSNTGDIAGGFPIAMVSFMGQLFVSLGATDNATTGKIYRIRPIIETAWTADTTTIVDWGFSMAVFQGNLYIGCMDDLGADALLLQRTAAGVYSTVDTQTSVDEADYYTGLTVYDGALYAHYYGVNGGPWLIRRSTNGTTWTTDLNLNTTFSITTKETGGTLVHGGNLYWVLISGSSDVSTTNRILRRSGGSWTSVYTGNVTGYIGVVEVEP